PVADAGIGVAAVDDYRVCITCFHMLHRQPERMSLDLVGCKNTGYCSAVLRTDDGEIFPAVLFEPACYAGCKKTFRSRNSAFYNIHQNTPLCFGIFSTFCSE